MDRPDRKGGGDEIDEYLSLLRGIARGIDARGGALHLGLDSLVTEGDEHALRLVELRGDLLSADDETRVLGLLPIGIFRHLAYRQRVAAFRACIELEDLIGEERLRHRFGRYEMSQPLFQAFPDYFNLVDGDLLPFAIVDEWRGDGVFRSGGRYLRTEPFLRPEIVTWVRDDLRVELFLRIDPGFVSDQEPPRRLLEAVLVPADPAWWRDLDIYRHQSKGSAYMLDPDVAADEDFVGYWEYHIRGLRRLEVSARRTLDQYLSMMLEELAELREVDSGLLGRMIHCDTAARRGTGAAKNAYVAHLDLAANIYLGDARSERLGQYLSRGRVRDATLRTHLLKVQDVRLEAVLAFAQLFFESKSLLGEWFNDQFTHGETD